MSRPTYARLFKSALKDNIECVRNLAPNSRLMAMVKANAYGHGLRSVALRIEAWVDGFGVASVEEAVVLRGIGITKSIHVMQGFFGEAQARVCLELQLSPVLYRWDHFDLLRHLASSLPDQPFFFWVKTHTGLNRLGFLPDETPRWLEHIQDFPSQWSWGWMTHWACADQPSHPVFLQQHAVIASLIGQYDFPCISINNSSALMHAPEFSCDWVRVGAALYGILPKGRSVMELRSEIIARRSLAAGENVGYGGDFSVSRPTELAVVSMGYGDGYPRQLSSAVVSIRGERCPILGSISMDMMMVDVTELADVAVGEEVILWGEMLPAHELAPYGGTIAYDLVTGVHHRVPFLWIDDERA